MSVAQQAGGLDSVVEQFAGLRELAALSPHPAERRDQEEYELPLPRSPRQGQSATGVRVCFRVPVEVELHPGEPRRCLQVARELVVRHGIDEHRRLRAIGFRPLGRPCHRIRDCELGEGRCRQRRVSELSRRARRPLGHFAHGVVPRAPEPVHGELEHECHCLPGALVGQAREGARQTIARLLLPSEQALDTGTGAGDPCAHRVRFGGHDRKGLEQGAVALGEAAGRCQSLRAGYDKLDSLLRGGGRREQAESFCEPVCGARRRQAHGFLAGSLQDGRRVEVALARRALDVMGAGRR